MLSVSTHAVVPYKLLLIAKVVVLAVLFSLISANRENMLLYFENKFYETHMTNYLNVYEWRSQNSVNASASKDGYFTFFDELFPLNDRKGQ